jgi:hypothetical protein
VIKGDAAPWLVLANQNSLIVNVYPSNLSGPRNEVAENLSMRGNRRLLLASTVQHAVCETDLTSEFTISEGAQAGHLFGKSQQECTTI